MNQSQGNRRGYSLKDWATVIVLAANFGGLVWFAATLNTVVDNLKLAQATQNITVEKLAERTTANSIDIALLKGKK